MPAVTVDNILALPRITETAPDSAARPVLAVTTAPLATRARGSLCAARSRAST
ncbi:hypothetical protein BTZ20_0385 [Rhodococcus sp. MTM3W5.2]|nr:hypothetical protein BTZ20_0385 [Rhodococcus sp. MTM3W5.2]